MFSGHTNKVLVHSGKKSPDRVLVDSREKAQSL